MYNKLDVKAAIKSVRTGVSPDDVVENMISHTSQVNALQEEGVDILRNLAVEFDFVEGVEAYFSDIAPHEYHNAVNALLADPELPEGMGAAIEDIAVRYHLWSAIGESETDLSPEGLTQMAMGNADSILGNDLIMYFEYATKTDPAIRKAGWAKAMKAFSKRQGDTLTRAEVLKALK